MPDIRDRMTGRLLPGARLPGAGSPVAKAMHARRMAILDATTDDDVKDVWEGIVSDAKKGDPIARKLFCDYILGKPAQPIELSAGGDDDRANEVLELRAKLTAFADRLPADKRYELAAFLAESTSENTVIELEGGNGGPANGNDIPA